MNNKAERVGSMIRALRESGGLTQSSIANYLGVDQSLISLAEKGKRALTSDMLEKLANLFGVELSAFQEEGIEPKPLSFSLRASDLKEEDLEAISSINRIALHSRFMTKLLESGRGNG